MFLLWVSLQRLGVFVLVWGGVVSLHIWPNMFGESVIEVSSCHGSLRACMYC